MAVTRKADLLASVSARPVPDRSGRNIGHSSALVVNSTVDLTVMSDRLAAASSTVDVSARMRRDLGDALADRRTWLSR